MPVKDDLNTGGGRTGQPPRGSAPARPYKPPVTPYRSTPPPAYRQPPVRPAYQRPPTAQQTMARNYQTNEQQRAQSRSTPVAPDRARQQRVQAQSVPSQSRTLADRLRQRQQSASTSRRLSANTVANRVRNMDAEYRNDTRLFDRDKGYAGSAQMQAADADYRNRLEAAQNQARTTFDGEYRNDLRLIDRNRGSAGSAALQGTDAYLRKQSERNGYDDRHRGSGANRNDLRAIYGKAEGKPDAPIIPPRRPGNRYDPRFSGPQEIPSNPYTGATPAATGSAYQPTFKHRFDFDRWNRHIKPGFDAFEDASNGAIFDAEVVDPLRAAENLWTQSSYGSRANPPRLPRTNENAEPPSPYPLMGTQQPSGTGSAYTPRSPRPPLNKGRQFALEVLQRTMGMPSFVPGQTIGDTLDTSNRIAGHTLAPALDIGLNLLRGEKDLLRPALSEFTASNENRFWNPQGMRDWWNSRAASGSEMDRVRQGYDAARLKGEGFYSARTAADDKLGFLEQIIRGAATDPLTYMGGGGAAGRVAQAVDPFGEAIGQGISRIGGAAYRGVRGAMRPPFNSTSGIVNRSLPDAPPAPRPQPFRDDALFDENTGAFSEIPRRARIYDTPYLHLSAAQRQAMDERIAAENIRIQQSLEQQKARVQADMLAAEREAAATRAVPPPRYGDPADDAVIEKANADILRRQQWMKEQESKRWWEREGEIARAQAEVDAAQHALEAERPRAFLRQRIAARDAQRGRPTSANRDLLAGDPRLTAAQTRYENAVEAFNALQDRPATPLRGPRADKPEPVTDEVAWMREVPAGEQADETGVEAALNELDKDQQDYYADMLHGRYQTYRALLDDLDNGSFPVEDYASIDDARASILNRLNEAERQLTLMGWRPAARIPQVEGGQIPELPRPQRLESSGYVKGSRGLQARLDAERAAQQRAQQQAMRAAGRPDRPEPMLPAAEPTDLNLRVDAAPYTPTPEDMLRDVYDVRGETYTRESEGRRAGNTRRDEGEGDLVYEGYDDPFEFDAPRYPPAESRGTRHELDDPLHSIGGTEYDRQFLNRGTYPARYATADTSFMVDQWTEPAGGSRLPPETRAITSFQNTPLSNDYPAPVVFEGIRYPTVEHAFQAAKTLDPKIRQEIAALNSPALARWRAGQVDLRPDWDEQRVPIMDALLKQKFSNPALREALEATGRTPLIHGNGWDDTFWGVSKGNGQNMLGKRLMKIRGIKMSRQSYADTLPRSAPVPPRLRTQRLTPAQIAASPPVYPRLSRVYEGGMQTRPVAPPDRIPPNRPSIDPRFLPRLSAEEMRERTRQTIRDRFAQLGPDLEEIPHDVPRSRPPVSGVPSSRSLTRPAQPNTTPRPEVIDRNPLTAARRRFNQNSVTDAPPAPTFQQAPESFPSEFLTERAYGSGIPPLPPRPTVHPSWGGRRGSNPGTGMPSRFAAPPVEGPRTDPRLIQPEDTNQRLGFLNNVNRRLDDLLRPRAADEPVTFRSTVVDFLRGRDPEIGPSRERLLRDAGLGPLYDMERFARKLVQGPSGDPYEIRQTFLPPRDDLLGAARGGRRDRWGNPILPFSSSETPISPETPWFTEIAPGEVPTFRGQPITLRPPIDPVAARTAYYGPREVPAPPPSRRVGGLRQGPQRRAPSQYGRGIPSRPAAASVAPSSQQPAASGMWEGEVMSPAGRTLPPSSSGERRPPPPSMDEIPDMWDAPRPGGSPVRQMPDGWYAYTGDPAQGRNGWVKGGSKKTRGQWPGPFKGAIGAAGLLGLPIAAMYGYNMNNNALQDRQHIGNMYAEQWTDQYGVPFDGAKIAEAMAANDPVSGIAFTPSDIQDALRYRDEVLKNARQTPAKTPMMWDAPKPGKSHSRKIGGAWYNYSGDPTQGTNGWVPADTSVPTTTPAQTPVDTKNVGAISRAADAFGKMDGKDPRAQALAMRELWKLAQSDPQAASQVKLPYGGPTVADWAAGMPEPFVVSNDAAGTSAIVAPLLQDAQDQWDAAKDNYRVSETEKQRIFTEYQNLEAEHKFWIRYVAEKAVQDMPEGPQKDQIRADVAAQMGVANYDDVIAATETWISTNGVDGLMGYYDEMDEGLLFYDDKSRKGPGLKAPLSSGRRRPPPPGAVSGAPVAQPSAPSEATATTPAATGAPSTGRPFRPTVQTAPASTRGGGGGPSGPAPTIYSPPRAGDSPLRVINGAWHGWDGSRWIPSGNPSSGGGGGGSYPRASGSGSYPRAAGGGGGTSRSRFPFEPGGYAGRYAINGQLVNHYYGTTPNEALIPETALTRGTVQNAPGVEAGAATGSRYPFVPGGYAGRYATGDGYLTAMYYGMTPDAELIPEYLLMEAGARGGQGDSRYPFSPGAYAGERLIDGQVRRVYYGDMEDQLIVEPDPVAATAFDTPYGDDATTINVGGTWYAYTGDLQAPGNINGWIPDAGGSGGGGGGGWSRGGGGGGSRRSSPPPPQIESFADLPLPEQNLLRMYLTSGDPAVQAGLRAMVEALAAKYGLSTARLFGLYSVQPSWRQFPSAPTRALY